MFLLLRKTINFSIEEVIHPKRTLPLSIVISMVTVLVLYVMVNISYFVVLTPQEFMSSWAVGITWGDKILGRGALFVPIVVACSVFGSACEASFSSARIIFAGARDGNFVEFFSFIDVKSRIPTPSIFLVSVLSLAYLLLPLKVGEIINMMGFLTAGFNALTMACHIVLRFNIKDASVPFRVPILVSFLLSVIYIYLFIAPLLNGVKKEIIFPIVFMSLGAVLYIPLILLQFKLPGLEYSVGFFQLLLQVAPVAVDPSHLQYRDNRYSEKSACCQSHRMLIRCLGSGD